MMILGLVGTVVSAMGTIASGKAQAQAAQTQAQMAMYQAKQEDRKAQTERAAAQRSAIEERREGRFALSTLQARAAASGGGAADPTVIALGESIAGRSEYGALMETYKGEDKARGWEDQAILHRMQAGAFNAQASGATAGSSLSAAGTIIGGLGSAFSKFKSPTPNFGYG